MATKQWAFTASLSFLVSAVIANMWHQLEGQKTKPKQTKAFSSISFRGGGAGRSYLGESLHCERSADRGGSHSRPVALPTCRRCQGVAASAAACTPAWCCAVFALKQKEEPFAVLVCHHTVDIRDKAVTAPNPWDTRGLRSWWNVRRPNVTRQLHPGFGRSICVGQTTHSFLWLRARHTHDSCSTKLRLSYSRRFTRSETRRRPETSPAESVTR